MNDVDKHNLCTDFFQIVYRENKQLFLMFNKVIVLVEKTGHLIKQ